MFVTEFITNYIYICTLYRELYTGDIYCIMCVYELYSVLLSREVVCICYVCILAYNYIFHYRWFSLSGLFCRLHCTRAGRIERPRMIIVSGLTRHVSLIAGLFTASDRNLHWAGLEWEYKCGIHKHMNKITSSVRKTSMHVKSPTRSAFANTRPHASAVLEVDRFTTQLLSLKVSNDREEGGGVLKEFLVTEHRIWSLVVGAGGRAI